MMFLLAAPAYAESWTLYAESETGTVYTFDQDSLRQNGSTFLVWVKMDYSKDRTKKERMTKERYRVDCLSETITVLTYIDYAPNGSILRSATINEYQQEVKPVVPGSIGQALHEALCSSLN